MWHCTVLLDGRLYWPSLPAMWHYTVPLDSSLYWFCLSSSGTVLCHWTVVSTGSTYRLCGTVLCHWAVVSTGSAYLLCGTVQYSTVQCSAVQCSTVQYSTVREACLYVCGEMCKNCKIYSFVAFFFAYLTLVPLFVPS